MKGFKVVTHDLCPPVQGGPALWNGALPVTIQADGLDTGPAECARGLNFTTDAATALKIAGLWPDGWPSRVFVVTVPETASSIKRGDKCRASSLTIQRELTEAEIEEAVRKFSAPFTPPVEEMVVEQMLWRRALSRPFYDEQAVQKGLRLALDTRGLKDWGLKQYGAAWAARYVWDARAAWAAWAARYVRDARAVWAAWDARYVRAAWAAWDARAALTVFFAVKQQWVDYSAAFLTDGLRDAYLNGLDVAVPADEKILGYAMVEKKSR